MIDWLEDEQGLAWLRRAVYGLVLAGFLAFLARGADGPADPMLDEAPSTTVPVVTAPPASPGPAPAPGG